MKLWFLDQWIYRTKIIGVFEERDNLRSVSCKCSLNVYRTNITRDRNVKTFLCFISFFIYLFFFISLVCEFTIDDIRSNANGEKAHAWPSAHPVQTAVNERVGRVWLILLSRVVRLKVQWTRDARGTVVSLHWSPQRWWIRGIALTMRGKMGEGRSPLSRFWKVDFVARICCSM